jgi:hypothetical protein
MSAHPQQLSPSQLEHAINVDPKEYPENMPCAMCGYMWMQHYGTLCPARPGYLELTTGKAVMPIFQNPDFDVE